MEQRRRHRLDQPPTWRGAFTRGGLAAVTLFLLATLLLNASPGEAIGLALLSAALYIPSFHMVDSFAYRRRQRKRQESQEAG